MNFYEKALDKLHKRICEGLSEFDFNLCKRVFTSGFLWSFVMLTFSFPPLGRCLFLNDTRY